ARGPGALDAHAESRVVEVLQLAAARLPALLEPITRCERERLEPEPAAEARRAGCKHPARIRGLRVARESAAEAFLVDHVEAQVQEIVSIERDRAPGVVHAEGGQA